MAKAESKHNPRAFVCSLQGHITLYISSKEIQDKGRVQALYSVARAINLTKETSNLDKATLSVIWHHIKNAQDPVMMWFPTLTGMVQGARLLVPINCRSFVLGASKKPVMKERAYNISKTGANFPPGYMLKKLEIVVSGSCKEVEIGAFDDLLKEGVIPVSGWKKSMAISTVIEKMKKEGLYPSKPRSSKLLSVQKKKIVEPSAPKEDTISLSWLE